MNAPHTLRLVTCNTMHGARANGYLGHPRLLAEACATLDADVLALQEVDKGVVRSGLRDLARMVADECDMQPPIYRETMDYHVGKYGNALLVKSGIAIVGEPEVETMEGGYRFKRRVGKHFLHGRTQEPRNAIFATLHTGERILHVAATHLSTEKGLRGRQLKIITERLATVSGAVALLGDLNMQKNEASKLFDGSLELPASSPKTYPAQEPIRAIDHIAVRGLSIQNVEARELPISDHRALVMDVGFY